MPPGAGSLRVDLTDARVEGGFPSLARDTEALIAPLRGKRITVEGLYLIADTLETLYREHGYALVRVTVPPQAIVDGGVLRLMVVDGFIERIDVSTLDPAVQRQVLAVLRPLEGRRQLRGDELERRLTLAGRLPGLALQSALQAGTQTGGTVLVVGGKLRRALGSAVADNRLSEALGPWETNVQLSVNQLLGLGEQVYVNAASGADLHSAYRGAARRRVIGTGLVVPLGIDGWALNPEFTKSTSQPAGTAYAPSTESTFERVTLRLVYPLILNRQQELTLTGTIDATHQLDVLPDFNYMLDEDRLRVARLGAAWSHAGTGIARYAASATLSKGVNALGARGGAELASSGVGASRPGANPAFSKLEANLSVDTDLPWGLEARTALHAQRALHGALPGAELFSLDGEDALSTWPAGALSDDGGITLRQEATRAFPVAFGGDNLVLSPVLFAAVGKAHSVVQTGLAQALRKSAGVGLRVGGPHYALSLEYTLGASPTLNANRKKLFIKAQVQL